MGLKIMTIELCKRLKDMVKDEEKGIKEYEELQFDVNKMGSSEEIENYVDILENIAHDESRHRGEIKQMMKDLKCK